MSASRRGGKLVLEECVHEESGCGNASRLRSPPRLHNGRVASPRARPSWREADKRPKCPELWIVNEFEERTIGGLVVRIDRLLCVGFGDCIAEVPDALVFGGEGIVTFTEAADGLDRQQIISVCEACPVDAITVYENGTQIAPQSA